MQVSALSPCCELNVHETKAALVPAYHEPYARVIDTLLSNNCEFRSMGLKEPKVRPRDRDICLSLYDTITGAPTRTKQLNALSNRVARTMLYGDEEDVAKLTKGMQAGRQAFLDEWVAGDEKTDEAYYYDSLLASLQAGLDAPAPSAAMGGGYSNAYQRFMAFLVQELGSRPASVDGELFDSFVRWESSLRKNLTQVRGPVDPWVGCICVVLLSCPTRRLIHDPSIHHLKNTHRTCGTRTPRSWLGSGRSTTTETAACWAARAAAAAPRRRAAGRACRCSASARTGR